jgi:hypothetical protein
MSQCGIFIATLLAQNVTVTVDTGTYAENFTTIYVPCESNHGIVSDMKR